MTEMDGRKDRLMDVRPVWPVAGVVCTVVCAVLLVLPGLAAAARGPVFGVKRFSMEAIAGQTVIPEKPALQPGRIDVVNVPETSLQAGGHPWGIVTTVEFNNELGGSREEAFPVGDPKDVVADLPPGFLGDPQAVPRCPIETVLNNIARCPTDTEVGIARLRWFGGVAESLAAIVNTTPEPGQSAEFAVETSKKIAVLLTGHVIRSGSTYGLTLVSSDIATVSLVEIETTFWGAPAEKTYDSERGLVCSNTGLGIAQCNGGGVSSGIAPVPFLTMPTGCTNGPVVTTIRTDSWKEPGRFVQASAAMPPVTGCNRLQFEPTIEAKPDTLLADAPIGLGIDLKVPQIETPEVPATPELRDSVVTLPEGMSVSPGIVDGIQACDESGPEGINFEGPESEEIGLSGEPQLAPGHCPDASTVGTAEAETPLLPSPVKGHVYLARPGCGNAALGQSPCTVRDALDGNLYQLYLELGGTGALADTGVNLKVHLRTEANPATGQLTTVVDNNPPLPFSELRIRLNGGPRAALDNPAACGPAVTSADFTPWSAPGRTPEGLFVPGTPDATPSSFFDVEGCQSPPPLKPGFVAGTAIPRAGRFSPFTVDLSRKDREQYVKGIQVRTPPGLLGMVSNVTLCPDAQANAGTCSDASKIGTVRVASGAGSHPFEIEGSVYLTGPYCPATPGVLGGRGDCAPFGVSIVTHAQAGPFNLGLVVVRARVDVDRDKGTLAVTTDETGPYAVPQLLFGVPLRLQRVTVNIDRPNFMFNPTNCKAQQISAAVSGSQDAVASVSSPFAAGGCRSLAFKPKFTVSTSGHTSRKSGASLDVKLSYPGKSMGSEANIAKVKVSLPRILPSRLSTLQQACPARVFEVNAANCPAGSIVGIARASTPLLPAKLSGPAYFVSHGGEAFPSLIVVLQGDNVRVDLTGTTFISKAGITSSTFKSVPDVPVGTFELYLPERKNSALAANANLCTHRGKLAMPTTFVAQNGLEVHQNTKIGVTGCAKAATGRNSIHTGGRR